MKTKNFLFCALIIQFCLVYGQTSFDREKHNRQVIESRSDYIDFFPDSLFYGNKILLFRNTPLSKRSGYSNVYHAHEVDLAFKTGLYSNDGAKGYRLSWMVRNDSLFIHRIYPLYASDAVENNALSEDVVISRMEKFTGGKFINDLLFVDWITGDLRVVTRHSPDAWGRPLTDQYGHKLDDRKYGSILTVKNGIVFNYTDDTSNNLSGKNNVVQRETDYDNVKNQARHYADAEPDTLYRDGERFFFRQSPLSLKQGYTDVFHEDEVSIFNSAGGSMNGGIVGLKGYHLTWVERNDSLFIKDIFPTFYDPEKPTLCKEVVFSRMKNFTDGRMINGLLFVDWISGDFGIISNHIRNIRESQNQEARTREEFDRNPFADNRHQGYIIHVDRGLVKKRQDI